MIEPHPLFYTPNSAFFFIVFRKGTRIQLRFPPVIRCFLARQQQNLCPEMQSKVKKGIDNAYYMSYSMFRSNIIRHIILYGQTKCFCREGRRGTPSVTTSGVHGIIIGYRVSGIGYRALASGIGHQAGRKKNQGPVCRRENAELNAGKEKSMIFNTGAALLDAIVLAVVSKEPEGTYGYKITQDVRQVIDLSESTLYPVLRRLQKDDCLEVYDRECAGRNRRYYKVTSSGWAQLWLYEGEWRSYSDKITSLFEGRG